jgi:polysaccharide export outer membrane protein
MAAIATVAFGLLKAGDHVVCSRGVFGNTTLLFQNFMAKFGVVTTFVGPYSEQIRVIGEAAKPQALPYRQKMTLLDVMIAVGGITDFADGNRASILRTSDSNKQYTVRIRDLIKRGDVSANVEMKPGDVLIIPQSWF